jgi:hypothetical protein
MMWEKLYKTKKVVGNEEMILVGLLLVQKEEHLKEIFGKTRRLA